MNESLAGAAPNLWDKLETANYTLTFSPFGYEINMKLEVHVDSRIGFPPDFGKNGSCLGVRGTDRFKLKCELDRKKSVIKFTDLFESKEDKFKRSKS